METTISLGNKVQDTISGFEGSVTAITTYLSGDILCHVESKATEKGIICEWINEKRLITLA